MKTKLQEEAKSRKEQVKNFDKYCAHELAIIIKKKRTEKELSTKQLSDLSGVNLEIIHNIENCTYAPDLCQLLIIINTLDINTKNFFNEIEMKISKKVNIY